MDNHIPTVAVLMSTYNGEKYIRVQLDSIFKQRDVRVKLFVRDDGSTDNTVEILKEYEKAHPVELLNDGENVGPGESFMRLVYKYANEPGIEYYAFADQDDIWLEEKLSVAVNSVINEEPGSLVPVLYCSNQFLYINDENKGNRHIKSQSIELIPHMTKNTIAGCTFLFNKSLAKMVADAGRPDQRIIRYRLHDSWMILVAICCGYVIYDETSHMLYRIHEENAVGVRKVSAHKRIRRLTNLILNRENSNLRMLTAKYLLTLFSKFNTDVESILYLFCNYKKDLRIRWQLDTNHKILKNCLENPLFFIIKVLFGVV